MLVEGGDLRFESLLDWIAPSLPSIVCLQASASSIYLSLPLASSPYFVVLPIFSVGPLSDGRPVPSLYSLVPSLVL
jgi:hypothetical protein